MSPASQGSLDVEHYTGSTLISARVGPKGKSNRPAPQHARHSYPQNNVISPCDCGTFKRPNHYCHHGATWTGMPLITMASNHRRNNNHHQRGPPPSHHVHTEDRTPPHHVSPEDRTPLSRLAIHTQGAPLILSGRYSNSNRKNRSVNRNNKANGPTDCLSIASDESSGSGQSENCLPRIIKPRKRRKKDRKPAIIDNNKSEESEEQRVATTKQKPYVPVHDTKPMKEVPSQQYKVLPRPTVEDDHYGPSLVHRFEDVKDSDNPISCSPSSCQCRYCDPSGIWDAPLLTSPQQPPPVFLSPPPNSKSFQFFEHPSHVKDHTDLVLRRSWSEPTRHSSTWKALDQQQQQQPRSHSFSEGAVTNEWSECDQWETLKGCDISESFVHSLFNNVNYDNLSLKVSTEIVTSPNGHRDLEIKFYSSQTADRSHE